MLDAQWTRERQGLRPDGVFTTSFGVTHPAVIRRLFDLKLIHFGATRYPPSRVTGIASAANHRAGEVPAEYERVARRLDLRFHPLHADCVGPVAARLRSLPTHGLCVGAFAETSSSVRDLLRVTVEAASERCWREAGAESAMMARGVYAGIYRRRWGCAIALAGARLRLARTHTASSTASPRAGSGSTSAFDPGSHAAFAAAEAWTEDGVPMGQRGSSSSSPSSGTDSA